jgi:NTE family protein
LGPGQERIDLLIHYLDKQLFDGKTYQALDRPEASAVSCPQCGRHGGGRSLPLHAAQAGANRDEDLLCSDLSQMPLAIPVAASAAFPVALSPVTLKNYLPAPRKGIPGRPTG